MFAWPLFGFWFLFADKAPAWFIALFMAACAMDIWVEKKKKE